MVDTKFLTVSQTAKMLNISSATVRRMIATGAIPSIKIAGTVRIPVQWVERVVSESLAAAR